MTKIERDGPEVVEAKELLGLALRRLAEYYALEEEIDKIKIELNPVAYGLAGDLVACQRGITETENETNMVELAGEIERLQQLMAAKKLELAELTADLDVLSLAIGREMEMVNLVEQKIWQQKYGGEMTSAASAHQMLYSLRWELFSTEFKINRDYRHKMAHDGFMVGPVDGQAGGLWLADKMSHLSGDWVFQAYLCGDLYPWSAVLFRPAWNEETVEIFRDRGYRRGDLVEWGTIDKKGIYYPTVDQRFK